MSQVGKAHHRKADIDGETFHAPKDGYAVSQNDAGNKVIISVQAVHRGDDERDGKAGPHYRIAEERIEGSVGLLRAHHQGQLSERIGQALVFDPLLAEEHGERNHDQVQAQENGQPGQQGFEPYHPGNRLRLGYPLVESADRLLTLGHQPVRHERQDFFSPLILRGGEIGYGGEHRDEIQGQSHGADRTGNGRHEVGDEEFAGGEGQRGEGATQQTIDEKRDEEQ